MRRRRRPEAYDHQREAKDAAPISGDRGAPPVGGERVATKTWLEAVEQFAGGGTRRLQPVLDRAGPADHHRRRPEAQLHPDRSAGRQDSADEARGAAAHRPAARGRRGSQRGRGGRRLRTARGVRRTGVAPAGGAMPARLQFHAPVRPRCRTTSTTTSSRSCRRATRC